MEEADKDYLLTNAAKVNWLKGVLIMEITDEAVRPFVETEITKFHNEIKANFRHGSLCGNCSSTTANQCSRGICSDITSQIVSEHRFGRPCYTNSDITKWLSDPWEIAKCYMSNSKDLEGKPECDLDYASIVSVVINNRRFERLVTAVNMADKCNVFSKGRTARNKTMHSRWHQMTETDLKDYCNIFIEIVKLTVADSEQYVKKIEKVRDTQLSLTKEEIVKLKEMAARSQEMTEASIKEIRDEAKQLVQYIKDEAEKVNGTSLMANFVEGCKESLYKLTVDHIRQQKPDHIREDDWTIKKFVECLSIFREKKNLSQRHLDMLFRKTHTEEDIRKWDPFLLCFILQIELHVPVSNNVLLYVKDVLEVRDELLHNGVAAKELLLLSDYLDEPLKSDILSISNKKYTVADTFQAGVALTSWCREERDFSNTSRYGRKDVEKDYDKNQDIIYLKEKVNTIEQLVVQLTREVKRLSETHPDEGATGGIAESYETTQEQEMPDAGGNGQISEGYGSEFEIIPRNVSPDEEILLQHMMTSFEQNNAIVMESDLEHFEKNTGVVPKRWKVGSIILEVECPSVEKLVGFWKGCTDGTVVKAMSKIRDAYRRYLGNDKLEFDIVLKKKEVTRRRNKIIEELKAHMKQLEEQVTNVDDIISRPVEEMKTHMTHLMEQVTDEAAFKSRPVEEMKTHMTHLMEQVTDVAALKSRPDPVKPPPETFTVEEAGESDTESLDDVKSKKMIEEEVLRIPDAVRPKIKQQEMPSTSDIVRPKIKQQEMPSTPGLPMKDVGYGEEEASRLVKFLRQISESLGGGNISTVKPYIRDILDHAKYDRKEEFDKSINDFTKMAMFKGGISINLIKQAIRGFDMIKEQPQFGDLVTSKLDAIEKEISEQIEKGTTRSQEKPIFEHSAVKTAVSIAEDTEVDESERPRPQATKILGKHSEKGVKSSMVSDTEDFKPSMKETDVYMKSSVSAEFTSEDDFMKKKIPSSSVATHPSLAKDTEEQAKQDSLRPEEPRS